MKILSNIGYYQPAATPYVLYAMIDSSNRVGACYKTATGGVYTYLQAAVLADAINQGKAAVQANINLSAFLNESAPAGVTAGVFTATNEPTTSLPFTYTGQAYGALTGDDLPIGFSFGLNAGADGTTTPAPVSSLTGNINSFISDLTTFNFTGLLSNYVTYIVFGFIAWRMGWLNSVVPKSLRVGKSRK